MYFQATKLFVFLFVSHCYYPSVSGQALRNGNRETPAKSISSSNEERREGNCILKLKHREKAQMARMEPEIEWEVARQNRITQQILQYYLERKLFPQLKRPASSRVPSAADILARERKNYNYDKIQSKLNVTKRKEQETLQSVESERVTSVYDTEEEALNALDEDEDCPNCVDDSSPTLNRWTMPLLKLGDKRYYLGIFFKANYFRATQFCRFHGMHLASISSQDENDKLEKYIKDFGLGHEHFWTSGTDLADEGKFFWMSTGRPLTFTNWNAGEPNNFVYENGEEENCLELWNRDGKGLKWNDSPCSFETFFVCEVHQ